jgi:hypothetical protein
MASPVVLLMLRGQLSKERSMLTFQIRDELSLHVETGPYFKEQFHMP